MPLPSIHPRHLAAAALALALPLTGCSSSHHTTSAGTTHPATPASGEPSASTSASASPDISAWPTVPTDVDETEVPKVDSEILSRNYTGKSFIDALTRQWHIDLDARTKFDSTKDDKPAVWHAEGTTHPTKGTELGVSVVWDLAGDLESLSCGATVKAPGRAAFLHACVRLDHPGADPAAAVRWVDSITGPTDRKFREAGVTTVSPLYRAGPAATELLEYGGGPTPTTYELRVFGVKS
ncbi:hypothetical protein ABZ642_26275 [Streptomyces sp. NPDC007157]|uniref:hypothetical protein n=1 Tax=Streptomyces sp. NPDC007157 TaxID=3154681 RepID=UPI0033F81C8E